ncbi:MAG: hypothetical protein J7L71_03555 [Spirochaetaceae bacterium]|nr:hypothetical protein [Spirochaetaceae bacterium]
MAEMKDFEQAQNAIAVISELGDKLNKIKDKVESEVYESLKAEVSESLIKHFEKSLKKVERIFSQFSENLKSIINNTIKNSAGDKAELPEISIKDIEDLKESINQSFEHFAEIVKTALISGFTGESLESFRKELNTEITGLHSKMYELDNKIEERISSNSELILNEAKKTIKNKIKNTLDKNSKEFKSLVNKVEDMEEKLNKLETNYRIIIKRIENIEGKIDGNNSLKMESELRKKIEGLEKRIKMIEERKEKQETKQKEVFDTQNLDAVYEFIEKRLEQMKVTNVETQKTENSKDVLRKLHEIEKAIKNKAEATSVSEINNTIMSLTKENKEMKQTLEKVSKEIEGLKHRSEEEAIRTMIKELVNNELFKIGLTSEDIKKIKEMLY